MIDLEGDRKAAEVESLLQHRRADQRAHIENERPYAGVVQLLDLR